MADYHRLDDASTATSHSRRIVDHAGSASSESPSSGQPLLASPSAGDTNGNSRAMSRAVLTSPGSPDVEMLSRNEWRDPKALQRANRRASDAASDSAKAQSRHTHRSRHLANCLRLAYFGTAPHSQRYFSSSALSPSSPSSSVPLELRAYTYQRESRRFDTALSRRESTVGAGATHGLADAAGGSYDDGDDFDDDDDESPESAPLQTDVATAKSGPFEDSLITEPTDLLQPPLTQQEMDTLYQKTASDYMDHLTDCLRVRVCAFLLFLLTVFICIWLSQGYWIVVLGAIYLMIASFLGIRGSLRGERKILDWYHRSLIIWLGLFALAFLIYMLVSGVEPTVNSRCEDPGFRSSYGPNCAKTPDACFSQCRFEMRINLLIVTIALAAIAAGAIAFLAWDAARVATAMYLWSYHPLRAQWHSDLMLFNRYADTSRYGAHHDEATDAFDDEAAEPIKAEQRHLAEQAKRRRAAAATSSASEDDASSSGRTGPRTFGSGRVGTTTAGATTARRRSGASTTAHDLFREQQQAQSQASDAEHKTQAQ